MGLVLRQVQPAGGCVARAAHRGHHVGIGVHFLDERQMRLAHALCAQPRGQEYVRKHSGRHDILYEEWAGIHHSGA
ncbi:hypothetical protein D3C72_1818330 [compost metagenome]